MEKRAEIAKEVDETIKVLITKIDANPTQWRHYNDLVIILTQIGDYNSAEELAMKALGLFANDLPGQQALLYTLGNVYYSAGEYQKAVSYYQQIVSDDVKADAFVMLAQTFMAQQDYQQAFVYALTAHEQLLQDEQLTVLLGDICLALGDFTQADAYYANVLATSVNVPALFGRGLVALAIGDDRQAETLFAQVKANDLHFYQVNQQRVDEIITVIQKNQTSKTETK